MYHTRLELVVLCLQGLCNRTHYLRVDLRRRSFARHAAERLLLSSFHMIIDIYCTQQRGRVSEPRPCRLSMLREASIPAALRGLQRLPLMHPNRSALRTGSVTSSCDAAPICSSLLNPMGPSIIRFIRLASVSQSSIAAAAAARPDESRWSPASSAVGSDARGTTDLDTKVPHAAPLQASTALKDDLHDAERSVVPRSFSG